MRACGTCLAITWRARLNHRWHRSRIAWSELDTIWSVAESRHFVEDSFQATAVINRAVQPPVALGHRPLRSKLADGSQCRDGFRHFVVVRINPGYVPATAIPSDKNYAATQGCLDRRQHVKTIEPKLLTPQLRRGDAMPVTPLLGFPGARAPGNGDPLPPRQMMAVSNQLRRRGDAVAMVQKPAQIAGCLAQGRQAAGAERTLIFGIGTPMSGGPLHGF
jgi:hypothetical protein